MSRTCLITGGSSGIGLELARQLAAQGDHVVLIGRDRQKLEAANQAITAAGGTCDVFSADVRQSADLEQIARDLQARGRSIDLLIVNAGIVEVDTVAEMSFARQSDVVQTNLLGAMATVTAFLPLVPPKGRVLFISSGFGLVGAAGYAAYCASKAGLGAYAETLQREVRRQGIVVQVACLADIDTPQFAYEMQSKPAWMAGTGARVTPAPVDVACRKILAASRGNRFFIILSPDVRALYHLTKLLPRGVRDWLVDRLLPSPR